jgi:ATP-dependent DNA helicase PIF1
MDDSVEIFKLFSTGENILLHGPAGTGKTYSINEMIKAVKLGDNTEYCVIAPTGNAANHIGGTTIHYNFGIGYTTTSADYAEIIHDYDFFEDKERTGMERKYHEMITKAVKFSSFRDTNLRYMFVDEISMVGATIFIIMDAILRTRIPRMKNVPMGGVQCILSGDFYQLPPVKDEFCFRTKVWDSLNLKKKDMLTCRRFTGGDNYFQFILRLRKAELLPEDVEMLKARKLAYDNKEFSNMAIEPLKLYPYNKDIDEINSRKLKEINEKEYSFKCVDTMRIITRVRDDKHKKRIEDEMSRLLNDAMKENLVVKVGAKIIFNRNYDVPMKLANGRLCEVIGIELAIKENQSEEEFFFDCALEESTDYNIDNYRIRIRTNEGAEHLIAPLTVSIDNNKFVCTRKQFPFMLAWAISCHRSQGQTLESAIVDAGGSFANGQSYVALSRVISEENLFISSLNINKIKADETVKRLFN